MVLSAFYLCLALTAGDDYSAEKPPGLLALEQARLAIRKADVRWNRSDFFSELSRGEKKYRRAIMCGNEIAFFDEGTADGVTAWKEDGEPVYQRRAELRNDDAYWWFDRDALYALLWEGERRPATAMPDEIRTMGLLPVSYSAQNVQEALWLYPMSDSSPRRYR
jgi:hypothetical protein